jgi:hypothetical protein
MIFLRMKPVRRGQIDLALGNHRAQYWRADVAPICGAPVHRGRRRRIRGNVSLAPRHASSGWSGRGSAPVNEPHNVGQETCAHSAVRKD